MKIPTFARHPYLRSFAAGISIAGTVYCVPALAADDAFVCMEESQEICDHKNKTMALFIKGREAFDRGREAGDLSEARGYALELIANEELKRGETLLRFIYVQVGLGVHKNLVQAYRWVTADMAAGAAYKRLNLEHVREQLAKRMTAEELNEAKR
jgi:hypothetical protein